MVLAASVGAARADGLAADPPPPADRRALTDWLGRMAGIPEPLVVWLDDGRVVALLDRQPVEGQPSNLRATVRVEILANDQIGPHGETSTSSDVMINCPSRRIRTDETRTFTEHGARGLQTTLRGDGRWTRAEPGSDTEAVVAAACDPGFANPLTAALADPALAPRPQLEASGPDFVARIMVARGLDDARRAAARIKAEAAGHGLTVSVQKARMGGRPAYQVVVDGFAGSAEAAAFCKAQGTGCRVSLAVP